MKIKVSLHIHTAEDPKDGCVINYTIYDLINYAKEKDFKVLTLTCHDCFVYKEKYGAYARKNGILLIPGIELSLKNFLICNNDVVVLNCDKDIEAIKNFEQLKQYKEKHPDIFIIAPHPDFGFFNAMGMKKLIKYIDIFDAIENSWFYSKRFNRNRKAERAAKKYNLPFIATSDIHSLKFFNSDYCILDVESLAIKNIFEAIRKKRYKNITESKNFFGLFKYFIIIKIKYWILKPINVIKKWKK